MTSSIQIMAISSTSTSGIFTIFYRNKPIEKKPAVILKRINQLLQNLVRVHNLVGSFDKVINVQIFLFLLFPLFSIVCLLSAFCCNFDTPLEVRDVH